MVPVGVGLKDYHVEPSSVQQNTHVGLDAAEGPRYQVAAGISVAGDYDVDGD